MGKQLNIEVMSNEQLLQVIISTGKHNIAVYETNRRKY